VERETRLVQAQGDGLSPPLDRSTTFRHGREHSYRRFTHPVGVEAEQLLGELDGGRALLFPSGMAAVTAVLLGLLSPGDQVALADDAYYGTGRLLEAELARWGIVTVQFDQTGPPPDGVRLVWTEAPSNPLLSLPDLDAAARAHALLVVDATALGPTLLRPLSQGADVVVHSATKLLAGHSDVMAGVVVCRDDQHAERLHELRTHKGLVASPADAWLLLRGLRTLALRAERQSASARELARRLAEHATVERVRYPGLGPLLSFDVGGGDAAQTVERATKVIVNATSLGGVESLIESRHRWEGDRVPPGLLRLSVGLEDVEDLWADLDQALRTAAG